MVKKHDGDEGKRKELPSKKVKPESDHITYISGVTRGTVAPNSTYRPDARKRLKSLNIYDNVSHIKEGIASQNNMKKLAKKLEAKGKPSSELEAEINKRVEFFKFNAINTRFRYDHIFIEVSDGKGGTKRKKKRKEGSGSDRELENFSDAGVPYGNQAHHILCCEAFAKKNGWTADLLGMVKDTTYDINNDFNIIYLPCVYGKPAKNKTVPTQCLYHNLPNHGKRHNKYNVKVIAAVSELQAFAQNALEEPDNCDNMDNKLKILDDIYNELLTIEDDFLEYLTDRGANVAMED